MKKKKPIKQHNFILRYEKSNSLSFRAENKNKYRKCLRAYYKWVDFYLFGIHFNKDSRYYMNNRYRRNTIFAKKN